MKIKSVLSGVYRSFYSPAFYREVAREWEAEPFLYAAWLLILAIAVYGVVLAVQYPRTFKPAFEDLIRQVPRIHVVKGQVSAEGPQPLRLKLHIKGQEQIIAVIDTGNRFKSIEETGAPVWLNSRELVTLNKGEKRIRSLAGARDYTIDAAWLREKALWVFRIALAVMVPVVFVMWYAFRMLMALVYAVLGLLSNAFFGSKLRFVQLWRISVVAMTPAFWLTAVNDVLPHKLPRPTLTGFLISFIYVSFAVWANIPTDDDLV